MCPQRTQILALHRFKSCYPTQISSTSSTEMLQHTLDTLTDCILWSAMKLFVIYTLRGEMEKKSIKGGNSLCQMTSYNRKCISSNKKMVQINKGNDRKKRDIGQKIESNGNKQYLTATFFIFICLCVCTSICARQNMKDKGQIAGVSSLFLPYVFICTNTYTQINIMSRKICINPIKLIKIFYKKALLTFLANNIPRETISKLT